MREFEWLKIQLSRELDLIPCSRKSSRFIYENDHPIAHYSLANRGGIKELTTVVVDPSHQGKKISYKIIEKCTEKTCVFTKHPALISALIKSGFEEKWWPGFVPFIVMMFERTWRVVRMLITLDWKRCLHQCRHLFSYRMYIRH